MFSLKVFLPLALIAGGISLAGCSVTGPPCTDTEHCVVNASVSNGKIVISRTEDPSAYAWSQPPVPAFPEPARTECVNAGGTPVHSEWTDISGHYSYECDQVHYVGTDGSIYYLNAQVQGDQLGDTSTAGTGATESECAKGWYPDASTGNPAGIPGKWDSAVSLCLPTNSDSQIPN